MDLQKAEKPYQQAQDAILETISLKKILQHSSVKHLFFNYFNPLAPNAPFL